MYERLERTQRARWVVHEDLGAGVWRLRRQRAARRQQLERSTAQLRDEASWRFVGIATLPLPGMER